MISTVILKYATVWLLEVIMAGKQFQFYLDIICNLDKFYMVLIKFAYLPPLNCTRDRILSLVSVQGTNGGQNQEKLIQCFIIPVYLMWWLSILSKLDCFFFHFPMQHIYITDYQWPFILIGTTSVLTNTQNVGTNANRCISLLCIYVLYRFFSALLWNIHYQIQGVEW